MDDKLGAWRPTKSRYASNSVSSDSSSPAYESPECYEMRERSQQCRDLRRGSAYMKSLASQYLPQYENEDDTDYLNRLKFASFYNFYNKAASSLLGKVFSKPPTLNKDVPSTVVEHLKDADLNGNDWTIVADQLFSAAMDEGVSWLLVDYHARENPEEELTLEQEKALGVRPYWIVIPQHRVLGVDYAKNGDVHTITMFRYWATDRVRDGEFGHKYVNRIYVYEPNRVRIFQEKEDSASSGEKWEVYDDRQITLGMVPVAALNLNQTGPYEAVPPMEDLAEMNVEHYQIRSDQRRALSVASFPLLSITGVKLDKPPKIGPMQGYYFESEKANMRWVESQGAHLRAGALELEVLEDKIRNFALSFESPGMYATATAVNVDSTDAVAPIIRWAYKLRDTMAIVLYNHAKWMKLGNGGTIDVDTAFIKSMLTIESLKILVQALDSGAITKETFLTRLKEYGIFGDKFDVASEVRKLEKIAQENKQIEAPRLSETDAPPPTPVAPIVPSENGE